jgi:microcystin degradation protein MlrC
MQVAIGSIMHESNSFNPEPTTLADFRVREAALRDWSTGNSEVAGFIEEGKRRGLDLIPMIYAAAAPKGPVTADAFEQLTARVLQSVRELKGLSGVLLALHGAMYTEEFPHADEEIVRRLRAALGDIPLVLTLDFHANISPGIVELTDVLLTYQQNPHIDTKQRGELAAAILSRMLAGEVRPRQALVKPPVLWNIVYQNTSEEPLRSITAASIELERRPEILAASVAGGYQYNDVPYIGPSVIVVADGEEALAAIEAQRLSDMMWEKRGEIVLNLPNAASAVAAAMQADRFPVALFDVGDNVGGGSSADETALLEELVRQQAKGWVMVVNDPSAVAAAQSAGIGGIFDRAVGGNSPGSATKPVSVKGAVQSLHAGTFLEPAVRHGGHRYWDMGHCAVIREERSTRDDLNLLLLTSLPTSPFSLHQLISCGIDPELQKILIVKGTVAPRAAYEPIAAKIILVDTPGATAVNPSRFVFRRARPGIFGMSG